MDISPKKIYEWPINTWRCSTFLVIREIQIKILMRYDFTPTRISTIKKTDKITSVEEFLLLCNGISGMCCGRVGHDCDQIWSLAQEFHMSWGSQKRKKEKNKCWGCGEIGVLHCWRNIKQPATLESYLSPHPCLCSFPGLPHTPEWDTCVYRLSSWTYVFHCTLIQGQSVCVCLCVWVSDLGQIGGKAMGWRSDLQTSSRPQT